MLLGQYETNSRRRHPSPSLTRSLPLVSPFQGCPLNPDIHVPFITSCEKLYDYSVVFEL
ncbi:MAG: hypothetical protein QE493_07100 [Verrucomicrobiae bacterium]|nr:hypothetical protein [Verrucomicrobiae bacterium]